MKLLSSVILHFGFAEDACISPLLVSTRFFGNPGYQDHRQGLIDLADDLFAAWKNSYYQDEPELSEEEFCYFLKSLTGHTFDNCPLQEDMEVSKDKYASARWYPYWCYNTYEDIIAGNFLFVGESAEVLICALLHHKYPDIFFENDKEIEDALKRVGTITTFGR